MAPADTEAYEQDWYRSMKILADRRARAGDEPEAHDPRPGAQPIGIAQLAAIEAVEALADIGGPSAVTALIESLEDPDAPVRVRVLEMLGDLRDRRAVDRVRALAGSDPDPDVVHAAKATLAKLDAP